MSVQGTYVEQPPMKPYMPAAPAQVGGIAPASGPYAPLIFEFHRAKVPNPNGSVITQFESAMPNLLAPVMSSNDFANRFMQINGIYAPRAQRIERIARIMKISVYTIVVLLLLAAAVNGIAGGNEIISAVMVMSSILIAAILLAVKSYVRVWKYRTLHAQVVALLQTFNNMDQPRRLHWSLTIERIYKPTINRRHRSWHEEPTIKLAMST